MSNIRSDDSPAVRTDPCDSYGESALLLVESLIHTLIGRSLLPLEDAIEIAAEACEALRCLNVEKGMDDLERRRAEAPLQAIGASLRTELL